MRLFFLIFVFLIILNLFFASIAEPSCGAIAQTYIKNSEKYFVIIEEIDGCGFKINDSYFFESDLINENETIFIFTKLEVVSPTPQGEIGFNEWEELTVYFNDFEIDNSFKIKDVFVEKNEKEVLINEDNKQEVLSSENNLNLVLILLLILFLFIVSIIFFKKMKDNKLKK